MKKEKCDICDKDLKLTDLLVCNNCNFDSDDFIRHNTAKRIFERLGGEKFINHYERLSNDSKSRCHDGRHIYDTLIWIRKEYLGEEKC